jgi:hypothetical protein
MLTTARALRLISRQKHKEQVMDRLMDSKYNKYLDSAIVRITLLAVGFSTWLGVSVAVLNAV